jgi:hypothetical protein
MTPIRQSALGMTLIAAALMAGCDQRSAEDPGSHPFAWPTDQGPRPATVGGHTHGVPVTLAVSPSPQWTALQSAGPGLARDRAAILAMCGEFRIDFDFQELVNLRPGGHLATPYQSWATERIFVLEDAQDDRISLQHQLVMVALDEHGRPTPAAGGQALAPGVGVAGRGRAALCRSRRQAGQERWHHEQLDPATAPG